MPKLTKRIVDAERPDAARRRYVWDTHIQGFGLLVLPSGVRSFIYQYRTPEGRSRRATIGKYGDWTPDQARKRAEEMRRAVQDGRDPLGERKRAREAPTLSEVFDRYLNSGRFAEKMESTQGIDRGRLERHLRPLLGNTFAHQLTTDGVRRAFADIRDGKTAGNVRTRARGLARVRGGEYAARDCIALLRAILGWAVGEGLIKTNPAVGVKLPTSGQRELILDGPSDYARLFKTLERMETELRLRPAIADAIRVIALTGARPGEIAGLRWAWVDLQRAALVIPRNDHKSGRRTGKPRVIALPAPAQAIIARQPEGAPEELVFKPAKGKGPAHLNKPWRQIREEAGLPEGIGLHGLRHSIGSSMAMAGAGAAEIMQALGHSQLHTTQRYIHWAEQARARLADKAADVALQGLAEAEGRTAAPVEPIRPGRAK